MYQYACREEPLSETAKRYTMSRNLHILGGLGCILDLFIILSLQYAQDDR